MSQKRFSTFFLVLAACAGLTVNSAVAEGTLSVGDDIVHAVTRFLEKKAESLSAGIPDSQWQVSVTPPGSVDRFALCTVDLAVEDTRAHEMGRQRLRVSCNGFRSWSLFVNGEVQIKAPVLVMATTRSSGDRLLKSDVSLQMRDISDLRRGYLTSFQALEDQTLRKRVRPGDVLTPALLNRAVAMRKGSRVTIRSGAGGLTVSVPGTVLDDGSIGDSVRVRNIASGKTVYGVVQNANVVLVEM